MRWWHHQLTHLHIHIDWSRNVLWKFAKLQSVITSLFFIIRFSLLYLKIFTLSSEIKLNLLWSSPLTNHFLPCDSDKNVGLRCRTLTKGSITLENDISRKWAEFVCHVHWQFDINAISLCLDINIFQQDACFCSKLGLEVEYSKSNLKTSLSQIWLIFHLLLCVRVGQYNSWELCFKYVKETTWSYFHRMTYVSYPSTDEYKELYIWLITLFSSFPVYMLTFYLCKRCWSPDVTHCVVMISWFTRTYCACAPVL